MSLQNQGNALKWERECTRWREKVEEYSRTVTKQQTTILQLRENYNEMWLSYAVQDGSRVIVPHSDRQIDVEEKITNILGLEDKFSFDVMSV